MMKKILILGLCMCSLAAFAQQLILPKDSSFYLKFSGYVQSQLSVGGKDATLNVGAAKSNEDADYILRMGLRRARLKLTTGTAYGMLNVEVNAAESGVSLLDAYLRVHTKDQMFMLQVGVWGRNFGFELNNPSVSIETMERSFVGDYMFPGLKDVGAKFVFSGKKNTAFSGFKAELAALNGNGIGKDCDNAKDIVLHLTNKWQFNDKTSLNVGASYYEGFVLLANDTAKHYKIGANDAFEQTSTKAGHYVSRRYVGMETQLVNKNKWGRTQFRMEVSTGVQPSEHGSNESLKSGKKYEKHLYSRNYLGGHAWLIHDIATTKLSLVCRYDYFDGNLKVSGNELSTAKGHTYADTQRTAVEAGVMWRPFANTLVHAAYIFNFNETSPTLVDATKDRNDDVFSLRLTYRF